MDPQRCSGITKRLDPNYNCLRCKGESRPIDGRTVTEVDVDSTMLDVEATFCYLGDMLCSCRGCDSAIAARCCVAWWKFRKLSPVLTTRQLSCSLRGKVYGACFRSAMLHGSKTWGPKELERLRRRNDRAWSIGSVASKTETKHPQLHYYSNLASRTLHQSFTVSDSVGRAMYKGPCPVSNLSQTFH